MKIYLQNNGEWRLYNIEKDSKELSGRNIVIGIGAKIGIGATIGNGAVIGNWAKIGDGATIGNGAKIGDWAKIGNWAVIGIGAKIGDVATIGNGAVIGNGVKIGNGAVIGNWAKIGYKISVTQSPLYIQGTKHSISDCCDGNLKIGCHIHSIKDWKNNYKEIGTDASYTDEEIAEYYDYILLAEKRMIKK